MQTLQFKSREGGQTVQLVRHRYDAAKKRSRTVSVGSVRIDAEDPERLPEGVWLAGGQTLDERDLARVRTWLAENGDECAAAARSAYVLALEQKILHRLQHESCAASSLDSFLGAASALDSAGAEMIRLAEVARASGKEPWEDLRPRYMSLLHAWNHFYEACKGSGITKKPPPCSLKRLGLRRASWKQ